jgi:16S rRNA processing protein RimM
VTSPDGDAEERVAVGRANAPWGVRGHVKVTPLTDNPERLAAGSVVFVAGIERRIVDVRRPSGYPVVQFEGVVDREGAESLRDALIEIDEADLPTLPEGEYYVHDLVGLRVVTTSGDEIGTLEEVLQTGSNDVYLVKRPGQKDVLIPAIDGVVIEVDVVTGTLTIEAVPGLFG